MRIYRSYRWYFYRLALFKVKLREKGIFEYVDGYTTVKEDVYVRHIKCGNIIKINPECAIKRTLDECEHCSKSIKYKTVDDINKELEEDYPNIRVIKEVKNQKNNKKIYLVECTTCNNRYRVAIEQLRLKTFKCCYNGGTSCFNKKIEIHTNLLFSELKDRRFKQGELYEICKDVTKTASYFRTLIIEKEKFAKELEASLKEKLRVYRSKKIKRNKLEREKAERRRKREEKKQNSQSDK